MSFFESISKKAKLKAAIKQTAEARSIGGHAADQLFKRVYQDYAETVANEPLIAEALYNWGLALLHQARTKSGEAAANLYQDAIAKFSFCLTIEPAYLGAALDGGVAYMELARVKTVGPDDSLYGKAKSYFEKANAIQAGAASYNVACIYGLRGEKETCLNALEISKNKGYLPVAADILADPDLDRVKDQDWFIDFMESLNKKPEVVAKISESVVEDTVENEEVELADELVNKEAEDTNAGEVVANEESDVDVKDDADVTPFKAAADYTTVAGEDAPDNKKDKVDETVEKS
jgi:tetratricopeptide (TPR) repeat protein